MEYKKMREYTHEEFVDLVTSLSEEELLDLSANYGGYPVLFRMALDERLSHIPFIQTGSSVIVVNDKNEILLQQRSDNGRWGLPGGCQDLGERLRTTAVRELYEETGIKVEEDELILIDTLSGEERKRTYPNGDVCYNNSSLYMVKLEPSRLTIKMDNESLKLEFFNINNLPESMHDGDMVEEYIKFINRKEV
ncbi:MAG: NUDIX domain-containing protein [Bacilli bacterium]|nr:NUDIX domain-containing protein [Bacilli bacterium]